MRAKGVNKAQQLQYIFECRNSGLTEYQWCSENGIHPETFYNWVSKLKKEGCQDIPNPVSRLGHKSVKQEIVKLDVSSEKTKVDNLPHRMEQNACFPDNSTNDAVVEIVLPNATIRFVNNTDPTLFRQTLRYLGGELC